MASDLFHPTIFFHFVVLILTLTTKITVNAKEKRLIRIALIIFVILASVQLYPAGNKFLRDYWQHIEDLKKKIEDSKKLQDKAESWKVENDRAKQLRDQINLGLIEGNSTQLVGVNMQKLLNDLARSTGITVRSMDPPKTEISKSGEWMLIIQTIQIETQSKSLMNFLKALDASPKKLIISNLNIQSSRSKLAGTVQITGFSRLNRH